MDKEKNPFRGYSIEEVKKAEASSYVIILNNDFFLYKERYAFNKETADRLFEMLMNGFKEISESGTKKEIEEVQELLLQFKMTPLRIH